MGAFGLRQGDQAPLIDGVEVTASAAELNALAGFTGAVGDLNKLDGLGATQTELDRAADASGFVEELTESGAVTAGVKCVNLNHATVAVDATIAAASAHAGFFAVVDNSASGTAAHTLTLTTGTFDGTNNKATLNAPGESLLVCFDDAGNGTIIVNTGSVALSSV